MKHKIIIPQIIISFILIGVIFSCVGLVSAVGTYPAVDPNMVLYYHFNNGTGENSTLIKDFSNGNLHNATAVGTQNYNVTGGYLGDGAYEYYNQVSYIDSNYNLNTTKPFSICYWVNLRNLSTLNYQVVDRDGGDTLLFSLVSNRLNFGYWTKDAVSKNDFLTGAINVNTNYYVCTTWDGTNFNLYNQGLWYKIIPNTNITDGTASLKIAKGTAGTRYLNGSVDELIIYNRSLSSSEIGTNYNNYLGCINLSTNTQSISGSATICSGTYYLNSSGSSTGNGVIIINNNNIIIDGNGSTIIGNGTGVGISGSGFSNITLINFNLSNFNRGIMVQNGSNYNISNINVNQSVAVNVLLRGISNSYLRKSFMQDSNGYGIQLDDFSSTVFSVNNTIESNYVNNIGIGIYLYQDSTGNLVSGNFVGNTSSGNQGIYLNGAGNNTVYNNVINNSGWNGILALSSYNNISFNTINNPRHNGIDLSAGADGNNNYNIIYSNILTNLNGDITYPITHALFIKNSTGNNFTNNIISNCGEGIASYYGSINTNNLFLNNSISNCSYGLMSATNNLYINNTFTNITYFDFTWLASSLFSNLTFYFDNSLFNIVSFDNQVDNYLYYENYNNTNSFVKPIYSLTSALLTNGTSLCNGSSSNLALNTGQVNITLAPNQFCYVFDNFNKVTSLPALQQVFTNQEINTIYSQLGAIQVNYTYSYNQNNQNGYNGMLNSVQGNIITMIMNFFGLSPAIGTILAVVILFVGIAILIIYIRKFNHKETNFNG